MDWMKHALEWLKTSPRYFFPVAVASGIILFVPETTLEPLGVFPIRVYGQPYLGLVFLFSSSVVACDIFMKIINIISGWYRYYKLLFNCKSRLAHLTVEEKKVLSRYLEKETRTQTFNRENGVVAGLVAAHILHPAVKVADISAFPSTWNFPFGNISALTQSLSISATKSEHIFP